MSLVVSLRPHPASAASPIEITVELSRLDSRRLSLWYVVKGNIACIKLPDLSEPSRADGLWQHTCFELFVSGDAGEGYSEYNFAPSREWAAYAFECYRAGMEPLDIEAPTISTASIAGSWALGVDVELPEVETDQPLFANLSAVIEAMDGTKSYWALAHPPEGPPDFHDPTCFMLELPSIIS